MEQRKVFIGSSEEARQQIAPFLKGFSLALGSGFSVVPWWSQETKQYLRDTLTHLDQAVRAFDYAVFIGWPDDSAQIRGRPFWVTRDNVVFEFGLFLAEYGPDRTFFLCPRLPDPDVFRIWTDLEGLHRPGFACVRSGDKFELEDVSFRAVMDDLAARITKDADEDRVADGQAAKQDLETLVQGWQAELRRRGTASTTRAQLLHHSRIRIGRLIELKALATDRTLQDAIADLALYFLHIEDMLDIEQLAKKQRVRADSPSGSIREVWVFADEPLEFFPQGADERVHGQLMKLRDTIATNLKEGVQYTYVVPPDFDVERIKTFLVAHKVPAEMFTNVTVIHLEAKHFKTFFTVHRLSGGQDDVYMSSLMKGRDDLLIKIKYPHDEKILRTVRRLYDASKAYESGVRVRNFVFEGSA